MSLPTKVQQDQKARLDAYAVARERGLSEIFRAYPIIPRSMANELMVEEICAHFLGVKYLTDAPAPRLVVFRSAVEADPSILGGGGSGVYIEPVEQQKAKIIHEIGQLLVGIRSPLELKNELSKLRFWSLGQLVARRNEIVEKQRLQPKSAETVRAELKSSRPAPGRYHPYDTLPEITANELKQILRSHRANEYFRRFGEAQLNDKLFGRI